ncbi:MAG TPA: hypothetical protein VD996_02365 [Chitinophagaceae bacterium]|nr:hypothetical protein [Chitinophagaceae bacterium]
MNRILICFFLLIAQISFAQNPLPEFSVTTKGNKKFIIGWVNAYPNVTQISIQRSFDSLRNFKTILTVPDPRIPQNGFVDSKAPTDFQFYRLFIVLDSGKYLFTKSQRATWDTGRLASTQQPIIKPTPDGRVVVTDTARAKNNQPSVTKLPEPERIFYVQKRDTLITQLFERDVKRFRDSILYRTRDTLVFKTADTLLIKPFVPKEVYKPSSYVFTAKDGNITISLPDIHNRKYNIKFFEEDSTPLFELKQVKESPLTLDKANFLHAGWFRFELYENGQLKEKHRFYIPKDF